MRTTTKIEASFLKNSNTKPHRPMPVSFKEGFGEVARVTDSIILLTKNFNDFQAHKDIASLNLLTASALTV